jgi:hypothetical protein
MKTEYSTLFQPMIDALEDVMEINAVILFGSRARGDALPHSDYDVVVIGNFTQTYFNRLDIVGRLAPPVAIDLFCYTPREFEAMFESYNITAIDSIGDGIVLHGHEFVGSYKERYDSFVQHGMRKGRAVLYPPREAISSY